jgi:CRP-like cAMP-binding protein
VAKKNLDFFHIPTVLIRGVVPYAAEDSFGFFNYQRRTRYPFAFLCSDIPKSRLDAIGGALELPGKQGLMALLELKQQTFATPSTLAPDGGLPPLDEASVPQEGVPMATRREFLDIGEWLRGTTLFRGFSVAEAAVLGTFLERRTVTAGATVVREGEQGDDLYLIESGTADVQMTTRDGRRVTINTLGPGDYFGEIALVTGGERTADVVATASMSLLRLSRDMMAKAKAEGDFRTALFAVMQARTNAELLERCTEKERAQAKRPSSRSSRHSKPRWIQMALSRPGGTAWAILTSTTSSSSLML